MNLTGYLLPFVFSFIFTLLLVLGALRFFPRLGLMDRPQKYGLTRSPIPYYGGLTIYLAVMVSVIVFMPLTTQVMGLMAAVSLLVLVSFIDDFRGLSPWFRLGIQLICALVVIFSGIKIGSVTNPFGGLLVLDNFTVAVPFLGEVLVLPILAILVTVFWILMVTNAMNFLDGLNGLPSGVTAIAALTLFLLSVRPHFHSIDQSLLSVLAIIVFGACVAFWLFDFYPARILMGDTGSMMLGFLLAVMSIFSGGKLATAFLVFGIPLLDLFWVVIRRVLFERRSPMVGDLKHFHHRLLGVGMSERKALFLIYCVCAIFGFLAVFLESKSKLFTIVAMLVLMVILGYTVVKKSAGKG